MREFMSPWYFHDTGLSDDNSNALSTVVLVNTIIPIIRVPSEYVTDAFPFPRVDGLLVELREANVITHIDLMQG